MATLKTREQFASYECVTSSRALTASREGAVAADAVLVDDFSTVTACREAATAAANEAAIAAGLTVGITSIDVTLYVARLLLYTASSLNPIPVIGGGPNRDGRRPTGALTTATAELPTEKRLPATSRRVPMPPTPRLAPIPRRDWSFRKRGFCITNTIVEQF